MRHRKVSHGMIAIRDLFTQSTYHKAQGEENQEEVGVQQIKSLILRLVEAEDKSKPLSDDKIAKALGKEGISLSRRVVTKYREQLCIASSYDRRE